MTFLKRWKGLLFTLALMAVAVLFGLHQGLSFNAMFAINLGLAAGAVGVITATAVETTHNWKTWNITCLDTDTTTTFAHKFGVAPDAAWIQAATSASTTLVNSWGLSVDATNITLTKLSATNSGGPSPTTSIVAKVFAWRPHTGAR